MEKYRKDLADIFRVLRKERPDLARYLYRNMRQGEAILSRIAFVYSVPQSELAGVKPGSVH